jgi:hypothetical protein
VIGEPAQSVAKATSGGFERSEMRHCSTSQRVRESPGCQGSDRCGRKKSGAAELAATEPDQLRTEPADRTYQCRTVGRNRQPARGKWRFRGSAQLADAHVWGARPTLTGSDRFRE